LKHSYYTAGSDGLLGVVFNSLTASPTMTLVEGIIKLPEETRENMKTSRNHRLNLDYDLVINREKTTDQLLSVVFLYDQTSKVFRLLFWRILKKRIKHIDKYM